MTGLLKCLVCVYVYRVSIWVKGLVTCLALYLYLRLCLCLGSRSLFVSVFVGSVSVSVSGVCVSVCACFWGICLEYCVWVKVLWLSLRTWAKKFPVSFKYNDWHSFPGTCCMWLLPWPCWTGCSCRCGTLPYMQGEDHWETYSAGEGAGASMKINLFSSSWFSMKLNYCVHPESNHIAW